MVLLAQAAACACGSWPLLRDDDFAKDALLSVASVNSAVIMGVRGADASFSPYFIRLQSVRHFGFANRKEVTNMNVNCILPLREVPTFDHFPSCTMLTLVTEC